MNVLSDLIRINIEKNMGITGVTDDFFALYLYNLLEKQDKNILLVVDSLYEANNIYSSVLNYTDKCYLFPMDDFLTSEAIAISPDLQINRLETINKLFNNDKSIIITNLMGYLRFLPEKKTYLNFINKIKVGDIFNPTDLCKMLIREGYEKTTIVNKTGDIAVRGFILDVFPLDEENPVRIEFFDDEIESIRYFDSDTQKSIQEIKEVTLKPYFEFLVEDDVIEEEFGKQKYLPKYGNVNNISDYLGDTYTFFKDIDQIKVSYQSMLEEIMTYKNTKDVNFKGNYMFNFEDVKIKYPLFYQSINNLGNEYIDNLIDYEVKSISSFSEDIDLINNFIKKSLYNNKTVVLCLKKYQLDNFSKKLTSKFVYSDLTDIKEHLLNLVDFNLEKGFIYKDFVFLSSKEIFNISVKKKKFNTKFKYKSNIKDINKLSVGDYVVHGIHGIGVYNGIKTLSNNNIVKDYLEVLYAGSDKIYIPVEKIDILYKYAGQEGKSPKINKLGGNEWNKTKERVRKKVTDVADKLLSLYAERESRRGFAFSPDCDMLRDFEKDFPYELTHDQKQAIEQIKADMEKPIPMDKLLCGDVGFGKTEVAFVAAFKAILDSKQVLFLCPTTILSSQHYENAKIRFRNFPVSIGLLNRFTPLKEVKRVLEGLKDGTIDMVFGTHRLLSDDVVPKDLGLLIIDEEQRFGVMHKEKIKQIKTNVDVLTLTATPIPRTLQMSLVGIRSLSLIETPPVNRYPVQTYVIEENKQIIRDAIYKELSRNGQVFILYNRVQSIEQEQNIIQNLVPEARIAIAHGQMNKYQLENRIMEFTNHEYDVLLCTTIIETGIDIPNVNTLIIIDADRFGLSQLYQIRGRVGRSNKFAYAYLMYQPFKSLTESAIKRLNVIKEFTELGSGFSIATRDLSIRGAGDILGSEQAGFIDSIGIDLYLKMLNDEVNRRKNIEVKSDVDDQPALLNVSTHIKDDYVNEDTLKIEIHQMINEIDSKEKFDKIKLELEDRFGKLDDNLIIYMYEEWFEKLVKKLKISRVKQTKNTIEMTFPEEVLNKLNVEDIFMDAFYVTNMFRFIGKEKSLIIVLDIIKLEKHPVYYLVELLDKIYNKFGNSIDLIKNK